MKDRRLTHWQENFAKYIYQETGYVPDLQTLKLAMLLQKQYRSSPWNKARLNKADGPGPLPELPYTIDEIRAHVPERPAAPTIDETVANFVKVMAGMAGKPEPVAGITPTQARFIESSLSEWDKLKRDMGPFWEHRMSEPFETIFTPEPGPDPDVVAKMENKVTAARNKAGRRKTT